MDKLIEAMKKVLADSFAMYLKAHYYHWNVEGPEFPQYHGLFDTIYSEVYGSIDTTSEEIRALNAYAPGSFSRFSSLTTIEDENTVPKAIEMVSRLAGDNQKVLTTLTTAQALAESIGEVGVSNYLQDRIDAHKKHAWMLRATLVKQ